MSAISVMIKPASGACNMDCGYCFYRDEASKRLKPDRGLMSLSTLKKIFSEAFEYAKKDPVYIVFQGGEPLLAGKDFFRQAIIWASELNKYGAPVYLNVQTNGTLIDDEWAKIFRHGNILVGLSIDGSEALNAMRVYADGGESFSDVMDAVNILNENGVEFNALCVVTKNVARNIRETYRFLRNNVSRFIQFVPVLKRARISADGMVSRERDFSAETDACGREYSLSADDYYAYLSGAFDEYLKDILTGKYTSVRIFDNLVRLSRGYRAEMCGMNGHCERQFVIEADGTAYPCDFFCLDAYETGNINECGFSALESSPAAVRFLKEGSVLREECAACAYYKLCGGGCRREALDIDKCEATKKFLRNALRHLVRIR